MVNKSIMSVLTYVPIKFLLLIYDKQGLSVRSYANTLGCYDQYIQSIRQKMCLDGLLTTDNKLTDKGLIVAEYCFKLSKVLE